MGKERELERDGVFITCIISQGQACESNCRWFHYKTCFHPRGYGNETIVPFQLLLQCWKPLATYALLICIYVLQYVEYGFSFLPAENIPMEAPPPLFALECLW